MQGDEEVPVVHLRDGFVVRVTEHKNFIQLFHGYLETLEKRKPLAKRPQQKSARATARSNGNTDKEKDKQRTKLANALLRLFYPANSHRFFCSEGPFHYQRLSVMHGIYFD